MVYNDKFVVKNDEDGMRLDRFLRKVTAMPQSYIERSLRQKKILLDGEYAKARMRVISGQIITLNGINYDTKKRDKSTKSVDLTRYSDLINQLRNAIIYEDEWLIAINKPSGIAVQSGSKIPISIDDLLPELVLSDVRPKIVHRLDRGTSGVLLLARSGYMARYLTAAFRNRTIRKTYWALTLGTPRAETINLPLTSMKISGEYKVIIDPKNGKEAVTKISRVTEVNSRVSLVELEPITGRKHQLRAHMAHLGCPIVGDNKYSKEWRKDSFAEFGDNLYLHARSIMLPGWPKIEADLPDYIQEKLPLSCLTQ
jgi:23S rRNA pseudouridine955/2504/2580 synthase